MSRALPRRGLLGASLAAAGAGLGVPGAAAATTAHGGNGQQGRPDTPQASLAVLKVGNRRWITGDLIERDSASRRRARTAGGQHPLAVVFTCIDSRVPPEHVFDQDLGDLFVVRTAGEALDALVAGSVEYGPAHGTPLVMVMGHSGCRAITATVEAIEDGAVFPGNIPAVVAALTPAYHEARPVFEPGWTKAQKADAVARVNVRMTMAKVPAPAAGGFYDLRSGVVDFFAKTF